MKEMKDYIPMYMGQNVVHVPDDGTTANIHGLDLSAGRIFVNNNDHQMYGELKMSEFKLILRPLSSMTKEEAEEIGWFDEGEVHYVKDFSSRWMFSSDSMLILLQKGFDIFDLKEAGLAVYEE